MIAVIADDFTGAAELGGIGWRFGLNVEVSTVVNAVSNAPLLVIDADTRSMQENDAVRIIEKLTKALLQIKPEWIYKKTDSVLRGHVVAELNAQLKLMGLQKALLVPANPNLGRTIRNGTYFFNELPVHQSSFSIDPEFAVTSSDLKEMLKAQVHVAKVNSAMPSSGIIVGEASDMKDIDSWAEQCNGEILPAGASGFFTALLSRYKKQSRAVQVYEPSSPLLYVSGTTFKKSSDSIKKIKAGGGPVSYQPADEIPELLKTYGKAILAIDPGIRYENAVALREETAQIVEKILKENKVGEILIEGGSTARAIFERLGYTSFYPVQELAPGVVRMKVKEQDGIFVTVKPGSYAWPEGTWKF
jgi:D-threonate/D-erythronate kinase